MVCNLLYLAAAVCCIYGVTAQSNTTEDFKIRLSAGSGPNEGIVEIYKKDKWGAICSPNWDINDATVTCKQLGYKLATLASSGDRFTASRTYDTYLDSVSCNGNEHSVDSCSHGTWVDTCSDVNTAAVICSSMTEFSVRLVGGLSRFEGRVEVFHLHTGVGPAEMWGTICNDYWDIYDAQVVCRQLGYGKATTAVDDGDRYYGKGTGPVLLESVTCSGTESTLALCLTPGWHVHNCAHNEDVGVICEFADTTYAKLSVLSIVLISIGSFFVLIVFIGCVFCMSSSSKKKRRRNTTFDRPVSYAASSQSVAAPEPNGFAEYRPYLSPPPPGFVVTTGGASGGTAGMDPMAPPPPYTEVAIDEKPTLN